MTAFLQRFTEAMSVASDNRDDPNVRHLIDANVGTMTGAYVAGGLDDDTRKHLMKSLADMRDVRASAAFTKAFNEYQRGKTDDDVKYAAGAIVALATAGTKLDQHVIDGLWACFMKYRPSMTNSIQGTQALHDAVLAVKDPSYGDKAIAAISAAVTLDDSPSSQGTRKVNDQIEFWQTTAIQVIKALHHTRAAKALVAVLMTRNKLGIARLAKSAIQSIPSEAEPLLAAALTGSDPDLAKLQAEWGPDKGYVANVIDVLAYTTLDSARDAILAYVPQLDTDTNRAAAAQMLVLFPTTPALAAAFKAIYAKLPPISDDPDERGNERIQLLGVVSEFFDPTLGSWALGEATHAKGTNMFYAKASAIQSAIKLMRPADVQSVGTALTSLEHSARSEGEKRGVDDVRAVLKNATAAVSKCAMSAPCYVKLLEEPIPQTPNANWRAIKAAHMAGALGNDRTRKDLIANIPRVTNPGARLAMANAINHLAPKGDASDADALEKIVADDTARKDTEALRGDDALSKVALMLRARH